MKNTKWIIVRGLARGYGHWGPFMQTMQSHFPNDSFYWLDLPGNGLLNNVVSPLHISEYAHSLQEQLKKTDFFDSDGAIYGLGLSLGAMVLVEWAKQEKDFFKKLFLINTSAANFSYPWKRLSGAVFLSSLKQLFTAKTEQFELNSLLVTTSLSHEKIVNEFRESHESLIHFSKKYPIKKINILRQLVAASYYFFPQESVGKVILIRGAKDRFINSQCSVDLQKKWNCKMLIHPTAGHDIAFEDADWLIEVLKANILLDLGDRV